MRKQVAEDIHEFIFGNRFYADWEKEIMVKRMIGEYGDDEFITQMDNLLDAAFEAMVEMEEGNVI